MTTTDNKIQFLYFTTVWLKSKQFSAYKEHFSQVLSFEFVLSVVLKYDVCKTILNQQIVLATLYIPTAPKFFQKLLTSDGVGTFSIIFEMSCSLKLINHDISNVCNSVFFSVTKSVDKNIESR